ncbi:MAG TPA: hypothetical protein VFQ91_18025 [Bryobacteraceae bacterium]|nr:hypothetical protein [Bryobacteraceae bacterium]
MEPANSELISGEQVRFTRKGAPFPDGTQFHFSPQLGKMAGPVYTAPARIWLGRTVTVTANVPNESTPAQATVTLSAEPFWIGIIGAYSVLAAILVVGALVNLWPLSQEVDRLVVSPPAVTLGSGESIRFYAAQNGTGQSNVSWSATSGVITPSGDYVAPKLAADATSPSTVTITAQSQTPNGPSAKAIVLVSSAGKLILNPSAVMLSPGQSQTFASGDKTATFAALSGDDGVLAAGPAAVASYKTPSSVPRPRIVTVTATAPDGKIASAHIFLSNGTGTDPQRVQMSWFASLMGAAGALVWTIRSFVSYVGSRKFRASWGMYYLLHPIFAAGLALVAYNGFPSLFDSGGSCTAITCTSIMKVAFYSGLVGLFSDTVMQKLRDITKVAFGTQEARTDQMAAAQKPQPQQNPASTAAGAGSAKPPAGNP